MFDRVLDLMDDYLPKTQASPLLSRFQQNRPGARRATVEKLKIAKR
jgi:hypothetical protein